MDFPDWNKYGSETERKAALALKDGKEPEAEAWNRKLVSPDESMAKSLEDILFVEPAYDGKKARPIKEKDEMVQDDKDLVKKPAESGSIVSPLDPPSS